MIWEKRQQIKKIFIKALKFSKHRNEVTMISYKVAILLSIFVISGVTSLECFECKYSYVYGHCSETDLIKCPPESNYCLDYVVPDARYISVNKRCATDKNVKECIENRGEKGCVTCTEDGCNHAKI